MNNLTITRYYFSPYFSGYFQEGYFYSENGKQLKKKSYNGRLCIVDNRKVFGLKKLRTFAKRKEILLEDVPF